MDRYLGYRSVDREIAQHTQSPGFESKCCINQSVVVCTWKMQAGGSEIEVHHPRLHNSQPGLHKILSQYNVDMKMTSELLATGAHHSHETFKNGVHTHIRTMIHSDF